MTPRAIVLAVMCAAVGLYGQTPGSVTNALPTAIRAELTAAFPGWQVAAFPAKLDRVWRRAFPDAIPNVLRGDYDGDGRLDVAVLIEYISGASSPQPKRVTRAFVFLHRVSGFRMLALTGEVEFNANDGLHLWPIARGEKGRDLNTPDVEFAYEHDAVAVLYANRGPCTSFIYRGGEFRSLWTCD